MNLKSLPGPWQKWNPFQTKKPKSKAQCAIHWLRVKFKRIPVQDVTIYRLIRAWAQDTPEAVALVSPGHEPITYRQLLLQTDAMIKSLRQIGVRRHDRIAIVLPDDLDAAVTLLGVSCCAISVPLNPSYQDNERESSLSDPGAELLIICSRL